ncbi:MAG: hypothetical protein ACREV0_02765 [Burkholderiales bacterium]
MPYYVQRDFSGKIVGLYASPAEQDDGFCLTDPDPLPDGHPEIVAFFEKHPAPKMEMPTPEQWTEIHRQHEKNEEDIRKLGQLMLSHFHEISSLELALSGLLQQTLNIQGAALNVARAIYFSIPGFDQRCITVGKALQQFVEDHLNADRKRYAEMESLIGLWSRIGERLKDVRGVRNVVAHGSINLVPHGGKHNARLTAPVFDPIRVGNVMIKGSNPGLGPDELEKAIAVVRKVSRCVDRMNDTVTAFHQFGLEALLKTRARLEVNLQALESLA